MSDLYFGRLSALVILRTVFKCSEDCNLSTSEFYGILNNKNCRRYSLTDYLCTPASYFSHFALHLIFCLLGSVCIVSRLSKDTTRTWSEVFAALRDITSTKAMKPVPNRCVIHSKFLPSLIFWNQRMYPMLPRGKTKFIHILPKLYILVISHPHCH